jgi:hypothetical protein
MLQNKGSIMAKSGYKSISRIDQPTKDTHGWYVRVLFNGVHRVKFFSDKVYGSKKKALDQAIEFRNKSEIELGKPRTDRLVIARNPRNSSGIMGVQIKKRIVKGPDGKPMKKDVYVVTWNPEPGRLKRIFVPVDERGSKAALKRACAIRREKEREMYGTTVKINWTASLGKLMSA